MLDLEKLKQDFADGKAVNPQNVRALIEEIERLQDRTKKFEAALRWYADGHNWMGGVCGSIEYKFDFSAETSYWKPDNGDLARKILKKGGE
jgi:hypothetical protein